ncbi:Ig-like domain-containing protein [Streptomyces sp. INA 01156]
MRRDPHHRTVVGRTLLVIALGAGVAGCSAVGDPLSAEPYDAADQISFSGPTAEGGTADPDTPLEVVAEDSDGRITDVTAVDTKGRHVAGELAADGSRWHSTSPLVADASYTIRVSTESADGRPAARSSPSPPASPPARAWASPSAPRRAPTASVSRSPPN